MKSLVLIESVLHVAGAVVLMHGVHSFVRSRVEPLPAKGARRFATAVVTRTVGYAIIVTAIVGCTLGGCALALGRAITGKGCIIVLLLVVVPVVVGVCEGSDNSAASESGR